MAKLRKTDSEIKQTVQEAIENLKPITVVIYLLSGDNENYIKYITNAILNKFHRTDILHICSTLIQGMVIYGTRATIKRAIFKDLNMDMFNPTEYEAGMQKISRYLLEPEVNKFKGLFKKHGLTLSTTFHFSHDSLSVRVKMNFPLLPQEESKLKNDLLRIEQCSNILDIFTEAAPVSPAIQEEIEQSSAIDGILLTQSGIDRHAFNVFCSSTHNESSIKVEIPLSQKFIFKKDMMMIEMENLINEYKDQFETALAQNMESLNTQTASVFRDLQSKIKKNYNESDALFNKIQRVGENLFEKQEIILNEYGEKVIKDVNGKLIEVRKESDKVLENIQKVGAYLLEKQKKRIDEFLVNLESNLNSHSQEILDKQKQKLEEFDRTLEDKIAKETKAIYQLGEQHFDKVKQVNEEAIQSLSQASQEITESSRQELTEAQTEFSKMKSDVDNGIKKIVILKNKTLNEMTTESEKIKTSVNTILEKASRLEKYGTMFKHMEMILSESERTYSNMTSMMDKIKEEEATVSEYIKNVEVLESAKKKTDEEIKNLEKQRHLISELRIDVDKTNDSYQFVKEKSEEIHDTVAIAQLISDKLNEIQNIQSVLEDKMSDLSSLSNKVNYLTSTVTTHTKKAQDFSDKVSNINKDIEFIEAKENELQRVFEEMDQKVSILNYKSLDIKFIESRFSKIENLMDDLSTRHKQIVTMQSRLDEMKKSLEYLMSEVDEKVNQLTSASSTVEPTVLSMNSRLK